MSAAVSDVEGAVSEAEIATVVSDRCVADGEPVEAHPTRVSAVTKLSVFPIEFIFTAYTRTSQRLG
jgi:hypothetical protein